MEAITAKQKSQCNVIHGIYVLLWLKPLRTSHISNLVPKISCERRPSSRLHLHAEHTSQPKMAEKRKRSEAGASGAPQKKRKGFQVGPANLPDGTYKRKSSYHTYDLRGVEPLLTR